MSPWKQAWLVAGWEFRRYFKWRDQFLGLLLFLVISALSYGVGKLAAGGRRSMTVAVSGVSVTAPEGSRLSFVPAPADSAERLRMLRDGDVSGILEPTFSGFALHVEKDPRYLSELRTILTDLARRERLQAAGLSESRLSEILAPAQVAVRYTDPDRQRAGPGERLVATIFLGLVMLAVFTSMAYLLTGITGEKQLRVTESITAIIPPQAWIDGKIIGIGAYALTNILNMVVGMVVLAVVAGTAWDFSLPGMIVRPGVIAVLAIFAALMLALWNSAFAAFASTIDDPNTSARTSLMFLPFLPVALSVSVLRDPDHVAARVLSLFPLTAPTAMPMRVMLSNPGVVEVGLAMLLVAATIWVLRRLAGRVFEIGMLMYGKEPSFSEIWKWARSRPT